MHPYRISPQEIQVYADASIEAIAAVAYLKFINPRDNTSVGSVLGGDKRTTKSAHASSSLEPCAAILAIEIPEPIKTCIRL